MGNKELCLALIHADTEAEVIDILTQAGYWNDTNYWRNYGDIENNFSVIGNQQSRPDSALMEKLVNSVDARLMNACLEAGIDPEGEHAPKSVREAVAIFFEHGKAPSSTCDGRISSWPEGQRREVSSGITLASTGHRPREGNPSITISDCGEGQMPRRFQDTLLSLNKANKLRIPFVQGKFNMGGTGVLQFCGHDNLQLVVSKRNPLLLEASRVEEDGSDTHWGFAVIRRERPEGSRRNSVYTYLAPVGAEANPEEGGILSFEADSLPIFPDQNNPYVRESGHGTLIKLFEFESPGFRSHILRRDSLLSRADLLLPEIALPIRFHECRRNYGGHAGSYDTTLTGLSVRLEDDKANNLEPGFPDSNVIRVAGEEMKVKVYAFKKGKAETYRKGECGLFIINGQTHAIMKSDFLRRSRVGMSYISDTVLLTIDCSEFSQGAIEDLFMNSRDRLRGGELRASIEAELEDFVKNHDGLRALKEKRRREDLEAKLDDSQPLADILESIIRQSPSLTSLFLSGTRLQTPFRTRGVQGETEEFAGSTHPSYFKFKDLDYGQTLEKDCHINMRCRVSFETDVENDYFDRAENPGKFKLSCVTEDEEIEIETYVLNLRNGIATLSISLPEDIKENDILLFSATVDDDVILEPFTNGLIVTVKEREEARPSSGSRRKNPSNNRGNDREQPSGIQMPNITDVAEEEWLNHSFDKYSALRVVNSGESGAPGEGGSDVSANGNIYDFYVNVDNLYLKTELKNNYEDAEVVRARFRYGLVIVGLALLQDNQDNHKGALVAEEEPTNGNDVDIEERIKQITRAVSPVLLPMIESLGGLNTSDFN